MVCRFRRRQTVVSLQAICQASGVIWLKLQPSATSQIFPANEGLIGSFEFSLTSVMRRLEHPRCSYRERGALATQRR